MGKLNVFVANRQIDGSIQKFWGVILVASSAVAKVLRFAERLFFCSICVDTF